MRRLHKATECSEFREGLLAALSSQAQEQIEVVIESVVAVAELHTPEQLGLCLGSESEQVRSREQDSNQDSAQKQETGNTVLLPQKKGSPWSALAPQKPATELLPTV